MKISPNSIGISPEFDRLKRVDEIYLNDELLTFVGKAYLTLESEGKFKRRDLFKRSLIYYAAIGNCTDILLYLLQSKANISSCDMHGPTTLS